MSTMGTVGTYEYLGSSIFIFQTRKTVNYSDRCSKGQNVIIIFINKRYHIKCKHCRLA